MDFLKIEKNRVVRQIVKLAQKEDVHLYLVGGVLRSHLLDPEMEVDNVDFLVLGDVPAFTEKVARHLKSRSVVINSQFKTVLIPVSQTEYEFSGPRDVVRINKENLDLPDDPLERDLMLRDFTINALAFQLSPERSKNIIDPCGGLKDFKKCILNTPIDPELALQEDPLRVMRAARFGAQLKFGLSPELLNAMHSTRDLLSNVATERITAELLRILSTPKPSIGLKLLWITAVLDVIYPEIARLANLDQQGKRHHKDVFEHTLKVLDTVAESDGDLDTRLAALLHDIGKPATRRYDDKDGWSFHGHEAIGEKLTRKLTRQWRLPSSTGDRVAKLVRLHMRPINLTDEGVTDSAVRRLSVQAGEDLEELMKLCRADVTSSDPRRVKRYLANFERVVDHVHHVIEKDKLRAFQSPVRGDEIMAETGLEPGPLVGKLKKMIEEAILDGVIPNEHDDALVYLKKIKKTVLSHPPEQ